MILVATAILGVTALAPPVSAHETLWLSPLNSVNLSPTAQIIEHGFPWHSLRIRPASGPVAGGGIGLTITLPSDVGIDSLVVCYEYSSAGPFIERTELISMLAPGNGTFVLDDPTDRNAFTLGCYSLDLLGTSVTGAITLRLSVNMPSGSWIEIGAIGIVTEPAPAPGARWDLSSKPTPFLD
jgi:hypothetical protein